MNEANDANKPWEHEQVPFTGTTATVEVPAANFESGNGPGAASGYTADTGGAAGAYPPPPAYGAATPSGYPAGAWQQTAGGQYAPVPPVITNAGGPKPVLAFILGLIPGVGAMYNGQVVKGFLHLLVFMALITIADQVDIFGVAVGGWVFFMAFEAYHTAKARRDGLALPDPFGWNDIGERWGLGKGWPFGQTTATASAARATSATATDTAAAGAANTWAPVQPPPSAAGVPPGANWAGYVSPSAFAGSQPSSPPYPGPGSVPPGHGVPYTPVNSGATYPPVAPFEDASSSSRLPIAALWLIGLGTLFLLGQWAPLLRFTHIWLPSLLLVGLAAFLFARRMGWLGTPLAPAVAALPPEVRAGTVIRLPGMLLTLAVLNGLNQAGVFRWHHSWPWLLIAAGGVLLVERIALRQAADIMLATSTQTAEGSR